MCIATRRVQASLPSTLQVSGAYRSSPVKEDVRTHPAILSALTKACHSGWAALGAAWGRAVRRCDVSYARRCLSFTRARRAQDAPPSLPYYSYRQSVLLEAGLQPRYLTTASSVDAALETLTGPVLGFDLEWNVDFQRGVSHRAAVVQLCTPSQLCIIQLSAMGWKLPASLEALLTDPARLKTGVAIRNDALKLLRDYGVRTRGVVELSVLARRAEPQRWRGHGRSLIALATLCETYLDRRLLKDSVRVSDWTREPLGLKQMEYAANDVAVSLDLYHILLARIEAGDKSSRGDVATLAIAHRPRPRTLDEAAQDAFLGPAAEPTPPPAVAPADASASVQAALEAGTFDLYLESLAPSRPSPGARAQPRDTSAAPLAHNRAFAHFLDPSAPSFEQVGALMRSVEEPLKRSTIAGYVLRALGEAERANKASDADQEDDRTERPEGGEDRATAGVEDDERSDAPLLDDEAKQRLGHELAHPETRIPRARYKHLLERLGVEVASNKS